MCNWSIINLGFLDFIQEFHLLEDVLTGADQLSHLFVALLVCKVIAQAFFYQLLPSLVYKVTADLF